MRFEITDGGQSVEMTAEDAAGAAESYGRSRGRVAIVAPTGTPGAYSLSFPKTDGKHGYNTRTFRVREIGGGDE